jgi:unsaturated rhamnogalacturonyl hydrolase
MTNRTKIGGRVRMTIMVCLLLCSHLFSQDVALERKKEAPRDRSALELMTLIADHQMQENQLMDGEYLRGDWAAVKQSKPPKVMYWSYPTGVTLLGMQRVYDISGDNRILKFVNDDIRISADLYAYLRWQKMEFGTVSSTEDIEKLWRLDMLDDCGAMGAAILEMKLRHSLKLTANGEELAGIIGNYVTNVQYRLKDGTFWRPNSPDGPTIWADDLYMSLPFLVRWAEYRNNDRAILDDAVRQILQYAAYLQDADGVWLHAYLVEKKAKSCCKWGRANGWVAVAIAEVLSVLPKDHPDYDRVKEICRKQLDGLLHYQSASGLWHQVIDHPELSWGSETSCSAQFVYALARGINRGWLDRSYTGAALKAFKALTTEITETGGINRVSRSTSIGNDLDYYNSRPTRDDDHHGNGLMLLALAEVYRLQNR